MPHDAIHDHAVLGNCRSAALVARDGAIDWLCWPRFDSPPVFGAILDAQRGGAFRLSAVGAATAERGYLGETNVLGTRHRTRGGVVRVLDLMPVCSDEEQRRLLLPEQELVRIVEGEAGEVEMQVEVAFRPGFEVARIETCHPETLGFRVATRGGALILRTNAPVRVDPGGVLRGAFRVKPGGRYHFSLTFTSEAPAVLPPLCGWTEDSLDRTLRWWIAWASRASYQGPYRRHVIRSALALKLLAYSPSGAIIAAPTTSLPEAMGGPLNWDYRFCWLRDAAATARALFGLGFCDEADAFIHWLTYITRLTRPRLNVLYNVYGEQPAPERVLPQLAGYRGSRPVRLGNAAQDQYQLDVYGEVIDAAAQFAATGGYFGREAARVLAQLGKFVCEHWHEPDEGIWEMRSGRRHHVHSRVMCWVALDRLLKLHAEGHLPRAPAALWARHRELIRREVELRGFSHAKQSYTRALDGDDLDANVLLLGTCGFEPASSPRMRGTLAAVRRELETREGLVHRNPELRQMGDGAFLICSFWAVQVLANGAGTVRQAQALLDRVLAYANDVGLLAEEIDVRTGEGLGNFPQGFSHIGLINAVLALEERARHRKRQPHYGRRRLVQEEAAWT